VAIIKSFGIYMSAEHTNRAPQRCAPVINNEELWVAVVREKVEAGRLIYLPHTRLLLQLRLLLD
jgi:hypothetical protein